MSKEDKQKEFLEVLELYISEYRKANGDEESLEALRSHSNLKDVKVYISSNDLRTDFTLDNNPYAFISYNGIEVQATSTGKFDLNIGDISDFDFRFNFKAFLHGVKACLLSDIPLPNRETLLVKDGTMEIPVPTQIQTKDPVLEVKAGILDNLLSSVELVIKKKQEK